MALASTIEVNDGAMTPTGIVVALQPASDPNAPIELSHAPDSAGAPDTANEAIVFSGAVPPNGMNFVDLLATDGVIWWYRVRVNGGQYGAGPYSEWINLGTAGRLTADAVASLGEGDSSTRSAAWEQQNSRIGPQGNLLPNPGFEEDGLPWWVAGTGTLALITSAANSQSGNRHAQLTSTTGVAATAIACDDLGKPRHFEVNTNDVVQFGGWLYRVSGTANVRYVLELTDKDKTNPTLFTTPNQNTAAWAQVQGQTIVGAGKKYARFWAEVDATGTGVVARVDDAYLRIALGAIYDVPPPNSLYEIRFANAVPDPDTVDGLQSYIDFVATTNFMRLARAPLVINSSTDATPISVNVTSHGYTTGDVVTIRGHTTNVAANGTWTITVTGASTFTLNGSAGSGAGAGANGHVVRLGLRIKPNGDLDVFGAVNADVFTSRLRGQGRSLLQTLTYEIPNAEFDCWDSPSQPSAWTVDTGDSSSVAQDTSVKFSGDESLKYSFGAGGSAGTYRGITTNDPTKGAFCVPLRPGLTYSIKIASRVSAIGAGESYRLTLTYNVAGSLTDNKVFAYKAATTWQVDEWLVTVPAGAEAVSKLAIEVTRGNTTAHDFWVDALRIAEQQLGFFDNGDKSADFTIDWAKGASQKVRITGTSTKVVSFTNPPIGNPLHLEIVRAANGGSYSLGADIGWSGGFPPLPTTLDDHADLYTFMFDAAESRYLAAALALDVAVNDVRIASGQLSLPVDVVSTTYTVDCGFQPKALLFFWSRQQGTGTAGGSPENGFGMAVSASSRGACTTLSEDGVAAPGQDTARAWREDCVMVEVDATNAVTGRVDLDAILVSGFRLIVDDQKASTHKLLWLAIGGNDVSAFFGRQTIGNAGGNESVSGVGFQPDTLFVGGINHPTSPPATGGISYLTFGVVDNNGDEGVWAGAGQDAVNPTNTGSYLRMGEFHAQVDVSGGAASTTNRLAWVSYDAGGFTYNRVEQDAQLTQFFFLALKGIRSKVQKITTRTDITGLIPISGLTFTPLAALLESHTKVEDASDTPTADNVWSLGVAERRRNVQTVTGSQDRDALATSQCGVSASDTEVYANISTGDALEGAMKVSAWRADGVDFIMTDADPSAVDVIALVLGG